MMMTMMMMMIRIMNVDDNNDDNNVDTDEVEDVYGAADSDDGNIQIYST